VGLNRLDDSGQPLPIPDVQRTTLSLDLMGRYVCNTWDEAVNNGGAPFDAVVIGSGMFGGYIADKLFRDSKLRVLVLEAGPFLVSTHFQNLPNLSLDVPGAIDPSADPGTPRSLVWGIPWRGNSQFPGQAYCVGGKSLYWGGWCPTLLPDDLAKWAQSSAEVADYLKANYPTLQRQVGILDSQGQVSTDYIEGPLFDTIKQKVDAVVGAKSVPNLDTSEFAPLAVQGMPPASGLFPFDKYSSVFLLVEAARDASGAPDNSRRLFVVPNTHVIRLTTANGMVTGIEASNNGAQKFLSISPTCPVILAMGTIESTRVALLSFPRTFNSNEELMGRNLMVHIRDNIEVQVKRLSIDPAGTLPKQLQTAAMLVRGSTPQGKFHLQVTASADTGSQPNPDRLLFSMIPDIDLVDSLLAMESSDMISFWFRGVSEVQGDRTTSVPSPGGSWINLSPFEKDEFGVPRAFVQISHTPGDTGLADAMDTATLGLVQKIANDKMGDFQILNKNRDAAGTTYHEAGTLWMGDDFRTSVTDANGRFHHVANAYCCDQSLFVTVGSVNPTLTGLTLSRKVAEAIVERATEAPPSPLEPDFNSLFDGSIVDWKNTGGGGLRVVAGNILETFGGVGLQWYSKKEFSDFILRVDWKSFQIEDNSGVFVRFPNLDGKPASVADAMGYEVQIDERGFNFGPNVYGDSLSKTGAIYKLAPARKGAAKQLGLWNSYEIMARGARITVQLNKQLVCDFTDAGPRSLRGFIGLQYHTGQVQFRNIRIKEL
jgi:choline dehydrogenase-like flavoprotein